MATTVLDVHIATLNTMDRELQRLHAELNSFSSGSSPGYSTIVSLINNLNQEIIRLSKSLDQGSKDDSKSE